MSRFKRIEQEKNTLESQITSEKTIENKTLLLTCFLSVVFIVSFNFLNDNPILTFLSVPTSLLFGFLISFFLFRTYYGIKESKLRFSAELAKVHLDMECKREEHRDKMGQKINLRAPPIYINSEKIY